MDWILDNGKWLIQLSADLLITIGTLTFAVLPINRLDYSGEIIDLR